MRSWPVGSGILLLTQGDIAQADCDAVVNAANAKLAGGGGVDGAIHRAAGWDDLQQACRNVIARQGPLRPGQAALTPGYRLKARFVIHAVGPVWRGGDRGEAGQLAAAYASSLLLAHANGLGRVAFPAISCGAYGYPVDLAVPVALRALCDGLEQGLVREAAMFLHGDAAFAAWTRITETFFA